MLKSKNSIEIHETAFVTSNYRSGDTELSKDIFASLWYNDKTDTWIEDYLNSVSKEEPYTHCLRNRFFYEKIKNSKVEVVINFGCGFSMYPFLLAENLIHIEIDKPDIIAYKKDAIENWTLGGQLPERNIHYIGTDFTKDYELELFEQISTIKQGKPSFILIEGVLFFLSANETLKLFDLFHKIQGKDELIGCVSFQDTMEQTPVFKKLITFFKEKVVLNDHFEYQTINNQFYESLSDYQLIDQQDYYSLTEKYAPTKVFTDDVLNESLYVLKKLPIL